jgi:hypothetical protein
MDVLYICREGENEELRYSLRSLVNLPHDRVIIAGGAPDWVDPKTVLLVPTAQEALTRLDGAAAKYRNGRRNLAAGLEVCSEDIVLMNDDIFVWSPQETVDTLTWGPVQNFLTAFRSTPEQPKSTYVEAEFKTCQWWKKGPGWSYALHVPFPFKRSLMKKTLQALPVGLHTRSAYGNMHSVGGQVVESDFKESGAFRRTTTLRMNGVVLRRPIVPRDGETPYVSTNDRSFRSAPIGRKVRERFPVPSPYERH